MILSVKGVMSRLSKSSSLLIVPCSDLTVKTLYFEEPFTLLLCFSTIELHIFEVNGLVDEEALVILICICVEGAKICAIFS